MSSSWWVCRWAPCLPHTVSGLAAGLRALAYARNKLRLYGLYHDSSFTYLQLERMDCTLGALLGSSYLGHGPGADHVDRVLPPQAGALRHRRRLAVGALSRARF